MIVKIIRNGVTSYYECRRARIYEERNSSVNIVTNVKVNMEDDDINLEVEKSETDIFIMNDNGKTIDSFRKIPNKR